MKLISILFPPVVIWLGQLVHDVRMTPGKTLPIALKVSPTVCLAPCLVRADVRIEPHPDNRWWVIELDGSVFSSGKYQLDGLAAPVQQRQVEFKSLPAGDYEVKAILYRLSGEVARQRQAVEVKGEAR